MDESSTLIGGDEAQFVFAYGSLVSPPGARPGRRWSPHGFVADLLGFRRAWGVAMDNRRTLPGYKYYTDTAGRRPEVFVTFLDVRPAVHPAAVNGVCLPVDGERLAVLDRRERNYERIDVSGRIRVDGAAGMRVWTYVGSAGGRERLRRGLAAGTAVIDANYLAGVRDGFTRLGGDEHQACAQSLDPGALPVVPLRRHPL
jgi:cation transport regulator ChaC